jgi:hypothetical protein
MPGPTTLPFPTNPVPYSRVLVIGHDPRLRESETLAQHAFFADFFFRPVPTKGNELAKYNLARAIYAYIGELTKPICGQGAIAYELL